MRLRVATLRVALLFVEMVTDDEVCGLAVWFSAHRNLLFVGRRIIVAGASAFRTKMDAVRVARYSHAIATLALAIRPTVSLKHGRRYFVSHESVEQYLPIFDFFRQLALKLTRKELKPAWGLILADHFRHLGVSSWRVGAHLKRLVLASG